MAANLCIRTIGTIANAWTALAPSRMVMDATIHIWRNGTTAAPLSICVDEGDPGEITYGLSFAVRQVDLSQIKIKGEANYRVTVVGYTV